MRDTTKLTKYVRLLMQHQQGMQLSSAAASILNQILLDVMDILATEASHLVKYTNRKTLSTRDLVAATKLLLPNHSKEGHFNKHSKGMHSPKRLNSHHRIGHMDGRKGNHSRHRHEGSSTFNYNENSMNQTNISEVVKHFQNALGKTGRGQRVCVCAYVE